MGPRVGVPPPAIFRAGHHAWQAGDFPPYYLDRRFFGQVARSLRDKASASEAFALLLRLLSGHFDRVDSGAGYKKLHTFGVPKGTPFCYFSREFRVVVSTVTGTERVLAPGTDIVWEVVRMAVNKQYPSFPGVMATVPGPLGTLNGMWLAFQARANNKAPAINGELFFPCLLRRRACGHPPRRAPDLPVMGVARAGRLLSRLHSRRDSARIQLQ